MSDLFEIKDFLVRCKSENSPVESDFTIEELYQAFKERFIREQNEVKINIIKADANLRVDLDGGAYSTTPNLKNTHK